MIIDNYYLNGQLVKKFSNMPEYLKNYFSEDTENAKFLVNEDKSLLLIKPENSFVFSDAGINLSSIKSFLRKVRILNLEKCSDSKKTNSKEGQTIFKTINSFCCKNMNELDKVLICYNPNNLDFDRILSSEGDLDSKFNDNEFIFKCCNQNWEYNENIFLQFIFLFKQPVPDEILLD